MASVVATIVFVVLLSSLAWLIQLGTVRESLTQADWSSDRRLWAPLSIVSLVTMLAYISGVSSQLDSPEAADLTSMLLAFVTTTVWVTLRRQASGQTTAPWVGFVASTVDPTGMTDASSSPPSPLDASLDLAEQSPPTQRAGSAAPGWYDDPWELQRLRRWNGLEWTTDTRA